MRSKILLFLISFFLMSCSGHVLVSTKHCKAPLGNWEYQRAQRYDFLIEEKVWQVSTWENTPKEKLVKDMLLNKGIECFSLESLAVQTTQNFGDILLSTIPFISRTTVRIRGRLDSDLESNNKVMEDDDDPKDGANL